MTDCDFCMEDCGDWPHTVHDDDCDRDTFSCRCDLWACDACCPDCKDSLEFIDAISVDPIVGGSALPAAHGFPPATRAGDAANACVPSDDHPHDHTQGEGQ